MSRLMLAALLALGSLLSASPATAQTGSRDQTRMIEQEYARQNNGAEISDSQLEYYLDRSNSGWSMDQISADIAQSSRTYTTSNPWRPQSGWVAREVVCTSVNNQYRECAAPFRGTAVITLQMSNAPCIEGTSWGQRPGMIWVNRGCRAQFGIVRSDRRTVSCQSYNRRYRECPLGFRGPVVLVRRLSTSSPCREGISWGQRPGTVWVRRGCRAEFASVGRGYPRDNYNNTGTAGWVRDENYAVTCSSEGRRITCPWDARYGTPRLVQTLSSSQCIEGRDWGYDNNGNLWVDSGCRGRFGYRSDNSGTSTGWVRDSNYSVTCSSEGRRITCPWDVRYGTPRLVQTLSSSQCIEGRDWGYDNNGNLWVDSGCRARFGYASDYGNPTTSAWVRDSNYGVTCSSDNGRRTICTWDNRYGMPRLVEQLSSTSCVEGHDWGYDSQTGLWVDFGCRARFGFR